MLIKDRDAKDEGIEQLRSLLSLRLTSKTRFLIERELKTLRPGEDGGKNAHHFINFYCADSPNWAIIHDLKLEHNGSTTHIDHLLINKFLDIYLFESKNYTYSLKITAGGEFLVFDGLQYQSVTSPLDENEERIRVLNQVLTNSDILPRRWGFSVKPLTQPFVLVSSKSNILRPPLSICDTRSVITADFLIQKLLVQVERLKRLLISVKRLPKAIKSTTLAEFAEQLASMNKPIPIDYPRLFCPDEIGNPAGGGVPERAAVKYGDYAI